MSKVRLYGDTSGYVDLKAPDIANDVTITLPNTTGPFATETYVDAAIPAGLGTNVVQTVKTNSFSSTSTSMTPITDVTATITPSSATSKILVVFHSMVGHSSSNGLFFGLLRGATAIGRGNDGDATVYFAPNTSLYGHVASFSYLDSPATTSATTYSLEGRTTGGTFYVNRPGAVDQEGIATLTLIEVAA